MNTQKKNPSVKNLLLAGILLFTAWLAGCSSPAPKTETATAPTTNALDTLRTFLQVQKMEIKANTLVQSGNYELGITQFTKCILFLDTALAKGNNKGISIYGNEIASICKSMQTAYDSLHQPENAVKCSLESLKWATLTHNYILQIISDTNIAGRLKNLAAAKSNDTARKGTLCREAVHYSLAGAHVIDSLKTNDMDDLRYGAYHLTSKIYALMGDKKQAQLYNKKYKDVYFNIFKRLPKD